MTDEEGTTALAVASAIVLETWPDEDFLPFSNAVFLWGEIAPNNHSFKKAVDASLCKPDGTLWDRAALEAALGLVLRRRHPEAFEEACP